MEQYGILIGTALLALVIACGWFLGAKAHAEVKNFREEKHESFLGGRPS